MIDVKKLFVGNKTHLKNTCENYYTPHLSGQSPTLCIIYCSDSRENIHIISDIEPKMGDIFTIENAGNIIDGSSSAIGSITYCLAHLNTKELLILGHTSCGAINAVFQNYTSDKPYIRDHIIYLENIKTIALHILSKLEGYKVTEEDIMNSEKFLAIASEINVDYQCEFARHMLKTQNLDVNIRIFGAIHDINGTYGGKNGALYMTDGKEKTEIPLEQTLKLVDYGENKTIKDIMEEMNLSFSSA